MQPFEEFIRGNRFRREEFDWPLEPVATTKLEGNGRSSLVQVFGDKVLVTSVGLLSCFDALSKDKCWEIKQTRPVTMKGLYDGNYYFAVVDGSLNAFIGDPTEPLWTISSDCYISGQTKTHLIINKKRNLIAINKSSGKEAWQYNQIKKPAYYVLVENDILIVVDNEGIHALAIDSGKKLWQLENQQLILCQFGNRLQEWRNERGSEKKETDFPLVRVGALIDGLLFIGVGFGVVVAIESGNGDIVWVWEYPKERKYNLQSSIIYQQEKLYFHDDKERSPLYSLDAKSGKEVFITKDAVVPEGIAGAVMAGTQYLCWSDKYITIWDTVTQEQIWTFENKNVNQNLVDGNFYSSGMVFISGKNNELTWFENSGAVEVKV